MYSADFGKELPCFGELKESKMNVSKYSARTRNIGESAFNSKENSYSLIGL